MKLTPSADELAYWLILHQDKVVQLGEEPGLLKCHWSALDFAAAYAGEIIKIGEYRQHNCYLLDLGSESPGSPRTELVGLRATLMTQSSDAYQLIARGWQLAHFLRTHRYCGQCGRSMHLVDWELAMLCHGCGHRCYPRISPCIITAIRKDKQILLAQGRHHKSGMFSTLAGFVESGESLEQAVHREVMEEVGIEVKNLRYFRSQPWPFPHQLMVGFLADYADGEIKVDGEEIIEAHWFSMDELPLIPPAFSISGQLIEATRQLIEG